MCKLEISIWNGNWEFGVNVGEIKFWGSDFVFNVLKWFIETQSFGIFLYKKWIEIFFQNLINLFNHI